MEIVLDGVSTVLWVPFRGPALICSNELLDSSDRGCGECWIPLTHP